MSASSPAAPRIEELLAATACGDRDAFRQLYDETSRKVFGVILRIVPQRDVAEDLLQDTYLRIWYRAATYRSDLGSPLAWMITIGRNRALDWRRQQHPTEPIDGLAEPSDGDAADPGWTRASFEGRRLRECLGELTNEQSSCIVLAYCYGATHDELAQRLHHPVGTIKSWIRRGLKRLKECIER